MDTGEEGEGRGEELDDKARASGDSPPTLLRTDNLATLRLLQR
jgi:hypothetical protein